MRRSRVLASLPVVFLFATAGPALAASSAGDASVDDRWLPWLGCWELALERYPTHDEPPADVLVCLARDASGPATVQVTTLADMESVMTETMLADGVQHPVQDLGCTGWRSAEWSRDGRRLFLRSGLTCEESVERSLSGIAFIDRRGRWVDVQSISSGSRRELVVRKYRRVSAEEAELAGFGDPALSRPEARWARAAAAAPMQVADVIDAAARLQPEALEAMLVEAGAGFPLDSAALVELSDAEVPTTAIDLMVALSYPDHFRVDRLGAQPQEAPPAASSGGGGSYASWYPFYLASFAYHPYWYGWGYDPWYGYGSGYWLLPTQQPEAGRHGHVVAGRGYTRVSPRSSSVGSTGQVSGYGGDGSSSSSSGSASSSGYSRGDSGSSGRTAKPRE